jgi:hypothetical protein
MPPVDPSHIPTGPSRRTPVVLIALAAILLMLRIATGVYEARHGVPALDTGGVLQIHP